MTSNNIETMTLTIELGNGDLHKLVVQKPGPQGDNPRFMAQQIAAGVADLARRADDLMETHGAQIRDDEESVGASINRAFRAFTR